MPANLPESSELSKEELEHTFWDVIIVGTGMGGATLGHELARMGHQVLFLEKGLSVKRGSSETEAISTEGPEGRLLCGRWPTKLSRQEGRGSIDFFAPIGCGTGGSTLLYAAALERLESSDFARESQSGEIAGGALSGTWPIKYEKFIPYYERAEELFQVCGAADPLNNIDSSTLPAAPKLSDNDAHFFDSFRNLGLHPYRLHVGFKYLPGCDECLGDLCPRNCKSDSNNICLQPALRSGNAYLLDQCEVIRLDSDKNAVRSVECHHNGQLRKLCAQIFVLAAGAYFTPVLLLNSHSSHWPNGLANGSGMVGQNLMFHTSDFVAVWPKGKFSSDGPKKTIGLRDFYTYEGKKLGVFQSAGRIAGYGNILSFLRAQFDSTRWRYASFLKPLLRIPAYLAVRMFGNATIFATVLEDLPYPENRIVSDPGKPSGLRIEYTIKDELKDRNRLFRDLLKNRLAPHRVVVLGSEINLNYGHPCGTCRFGDDPNTSVLDPDNRAHEVENLFVVDASFFPSSGGANPSLTIAANALRVAEVVNKQLTDRPPQTLD